MSQEATGVQQIVDAVRRSIPLVQFELPVEFFPVHMSVALIDAVFRPEFRERTAAITERYCHRFGIAEIGKPYRKFPRPSEEECLSDLIRHYDELGMETMMDEVFKSRDRSTGTTTTKAQSVLGAARALRDVGIDDLPYRPTRQPEEIRDTLRPLLGIGPCTIRLLSMYLGGRDFVWGDFAVRSFVECALGERVVPASRAESLVRGAAHELIVSPQFLVADRPNGATHVRVNGATHGC